MCLDACIGIPGMGAAMFDAPSTSRPGDCSAICMLMVWLNCVLPGYYYRSRLIRTSLTRLSAARGGLPSGHRETRWWSSSAMTLLSISVEA